MKSINEAMVILLHLVTYGYSQNCEYSANTITCRGIQQEEFLNQILTLAAIYSEEEIYTISILDSNFSKIDYLPDPSKFVTQFRVNTLIIHNSGITHIADDAFIDYASTFIDRRKILLRDNHIENTSFAKIFRENSLASLDLSGNNIRILDLQHFQVPYLDIHLDSNNIDSVKPASKPILYNSIDLSHNNLREFNESYLNCFCIAIDLSYNDLHTLSLDSTSSLTYRTRGNIDIRMNDLSSLREPDSSTFRCDALYSTSLINDRMSINSVLSFSNSDIGILGKTVWNISSFEIGDRAILDLSNASISSIAQYYFEISLHTLNLSYNNISSLEHGIFRNSRIVNLDLSFSGIRNLSGNSFNGLSSQGYTSDMRLNLSGNQFEAIANICDDSARFRSIDLSFNTFQSIGSDTFASCTELRTLNISNSVIRSIEPGFLNSIPSITDLVLSSSNISNLQAFTFANHSYISHIDLSYSDLRLLESNVFYNLAVVTLKLKNSQIYYIASKAFNNLYNLDLLDLSSCGITTIDEEAFFAMNRIRTIDLSGNNLMVINSNTFRNIQVRWLNLSQNGIKSLSSHSFVNLELNFLDLSFNNLNGIRSDSFRNSIIGEILLVHNNISAPIAFDQSVKVTSLSVSLNGEFDQQSISQIYLERLYLVESSIKVLKNDCFVGFPYLKTIYFNKSRIDSLESRALNGLYSLEELDSSTLFNNSRILRKDTFSDLVKLKYLHLIDISTLSSLDEGSLSNLKSLEILHITGTSIRTLPSNIFDELKSLRILDLSNNSLTDLGSPNPFNNLYKLETLRLDFNRLTLLPPGIFDDLNSLRVLNLSQNAALFQSYGSRSFVAIETLTGLQKLNIDNTYMSEQSLKYSTFLTYFPALKSIGINNNRFSCSVLIEMLNYFTSRNVIYAPENPTYGTTNLNGVACIN